MKLLEIERANLKDRDFLRSMIWEAVKASPTFVATTGLQKVRQIEDVYWDNWQPQTDPAFVALSQGKPIGAIVLKPNLKVLEKMIGWQFGIGIVEAERGKGVGRQLIEYAIDYCRVNSAQYLTLFVDPSNQAAKKLYTNLGFRQVAHIMGLDEMRLVF